MQFQDISKLNYFEIFNLSQSYSIDKAILEQSFLKAQQIYHPDSANSSLQKMRSSINSSIINMAYETLVDDVKRACYIAKLWYNTDILAEQKTFKNPLLIMDVLELQMQFEEIKTSKNQLTKFTNTIQAKLYQINNEVKNLLSVKYSQNNPNQEIIINTITKFVFIDKLLKNALSV